MVTPQSTYNSFFFYWNTLNFNDQLSLTMNLISKFHDKMMIYLMMILIFIFSLIIYIMNNKNMNVFFNDLDIMELGWTMIPIMIILVILFPSLKILYSNESLMISFYQMTLKVMGNQWFWSFSLTSEMSEFLNKSLIFNSYLSNFKSSEMNKKFFNIGINNVENKVFIPYSTSIRVLITSSDVIHSWSLPSMGVKMDAIPGRINQLELFFKSMGVFFGQCTEICGMNHSIMPFILFSLPLKDCLILNDLMDFFNN